ncbi:MAG: mitochondrial glycerol-3-phosphate dehydrogenase [Geoglossum simile]|nr:MAG: mitochondrial glycerol-3-phosphate dehydrogenase [Geoglossum simile]
MSYEWFRPYGSAFAVHRRRPRPRAEFVDVTERAHYPVIINPDPSMQIARHVGEVCDNQFILNENQRFLDGRMDRLEINQARLLDTSRRILHSTAKQSRQLGCIDEGLRYASQLGPEVIREREVEYIAPRPLLLDAPYHHRRERAYIGDGVTYITSRQRRRPGWAPPMQHSDTEFSEVDEQAIGCEPPGSMRRRTTVVHQPASLAGGVIYVSYRPRNLPGSDPTDGSPAYGAGRPNKPPRFPGLKSRDEQIGELKRSAGVSSDVQEASGWGVAEWLFKGGRNSGQTSKTGGDEEEPYDLLIIGGGATGSGIALDAVTRGLRVAMVERDDFSSGASSKSTKLVHGGVRYLEKAVWDLDYSQYKLVKEALRERKYFLDTAPHLSMWLPIMLPIYQWRKAPYYWLGTKCYDLLAGAENIESSYFLTRSKALDSFPMLKRNGLVGALVYYDGAHNDSRMNVSLAVTAALYGATVVNHLEVTGLEKDASGKLCGACVKDLVLERNWGEAREFKIKAKA